jgi:hypothetical protein
LSPEATHAQGISFAKPLVDWPIQYLLLLHRRYFYQALVDVPIPCTTIMLGLVTGKWVSPYNLL